MAPPLPISRRTAAAIAIDQWFEGKTAKEIATHMRGFGLVVEEAAILKCVRIHLKTVDENKRYGKGQTK